ncbi:hypothetical protein BLOT_000724 [Blomia tropicalis]|nr:hypothetical protein BLOT_000724 [Blomia tropicalis]
MVDGSFGCRRRETMNKPTNLPPICVLFQIAEYNSGRSKQQPSARTRSPPPQSSSTTAATTKTTLPIENENDKKSEHTLYLNIRQNFRVTSN